MGSVRDNESELQNILDAALQHDAVILSGGTSKGAGDLSYRVVSRLTDPGIVAHGVALKPGKPICLAATAGKPVVILPGFPTSAIFTFHEFVAPVIRQLGGRPVVHRKTLPATLPMQLNSDRGRTEYNLVGLVESTHEGKNELIAYPIGKGSGSVTTFSHADGFFTIDQHTEIVPAGSNVEVTLIDSTLEPADLVVIGSHCVGLDLLLSRLRHEGFRVKSLQVGSTGGLAATQRRECDIAGIHLLDPVTDTYNVPFLTTEIELIDGYERQQSFLYRADDKRFLQLTQEHASDKPGGVSHLDLALKNVLSDSECAMVNRNPGSGTRILTDRLLAEFVARHPGLSLTTKPLGYGVQAKSHNAVAAAIAQGRGDWGVAIETVAAHYSLLTIPIRAEHFDFVVPKSRADRPAVRRFRELLQEEETHRSLAEIGFTRYS